MIESLIAVHTAHEVRVLVCETGHRWCDAARRFIGPFQHAPADSFGRSPDRAKRTLFLVQPARRDQVRAAIQGARHAAILWELSPDNVAQVGASIAQIGVGRPDVLQLVGLDHGHTPRLRRLGLELMELGVRAIAEHPEDLAITARMVHRRFGNPAESP